MGLDGSGLILQKKRRFGIFLLTQFYFKDKRDLTETAKPNLVNCYNYFSRLKSVLSDVIFGIQTISLVPTLEIYWCKYPDQLFSQNILNWTQPCQLSYLAFNFREGTSAETRPLLAYSDFLQTEKKKKCSISTDFFGV